MTERIETVIAAAAACLDKAVPGWAAKIDLARLDIKDCNACIADQVFNQNGWPGFREAVASMPKEDSDLAFSITRGHELPREALEEPWRREIAKRL